VSHRFSCAVLALAMIVAGAATRADAQGLTANLSGVVTDTGGGVMPGATVTIKNVGTNLVKETVTGVDGAFVFPDLLAGTFDLTVNVQGFKSYEQKGIVVGATERVALRAITLEVGALEETVSVTSEATLVQTNGGARSGLITRDNIDNIALKGRDFAGMLKILPGVVDTSAREAPGWGSMGGLTINGRSGGFNFSYDGAVLVGCTFGRRSLSPPPGGGAADAMRPCFGWKGSWPARKCNLRGVLRGITQFRLLYLQA
jgi:hypothetical protein